MIRAISVVLLAVVTAGCALFPNSEPPTTTAFVVTTSSSSTSTSSTSSSTTTTIFDPGPVLGLITPTGIPVMVLQDLGTEYLVITPCGEEATVRGGEPLHRIPVVLDPGHGGPRSIGTQGRNGLPEKVLNLDLSFAIQEVLTARGIPSVLTRVDDYGVTITQRARFADHLQAEALVSIHHNAPAPARSATPGTEVFYQSTSDASRRLGGLLWEYTYTALLQFDVDWVAANDAGALTVLNPQGLDTYGLMRLPETPSALLEVGYLHNPAEAELMATQEYLDVVSVAIADAIQAYLETDEPGSGWSGTRHFTAAPGLTPEQCTDPDLE